MCSRIWHKVTQALLGPCTLPCAAAAFKSSLPRAALLPLKKTGACRQGVHPAGRDHPPACAGAWEAVFCARVAWSSLEQMLPVARWRGCGFRALRRALLPPPCGERSGTPQRRHPARSQRTAEGVLCAALTHCMRVRPARRPTPTRRRTTILSWTAPTCPTCAGLFGLCACATKHRMRRGAGRALMLNDEGLAPARRYHPYTAPAPGERPATSPLPAVYIFVPPLRRR